MISVHVFGLVTSKDESKKKIKFKNVVILLLFAVLHTIAYLYLKGTYKTNSTMRNIFYIFLHSI